MRRHTSLHSRHVGARNVWDLITLLEPAYTPKQAGQHRPGRPQETQDYMLTTEALLRVVCPPSRVLWTSPILEGVNLSGDVPELRPLRQKLRPRGQSQGVFLRRAILACMSTIRGARSTVDAPHHPRPRMDAV
jgi:hypothetical protein